MDDSQSQIRYCMYGSLLELWGLNSTWNLGSDLLISTGEIQVASCGNHDDSLQSRLELSNKCPAVSPNLKHGLKCFCPCPVHNCNKLWSCQCDFHGSDSLKLSSLHGALPLPSALIVSYLFNLTLSSIPLWNILHTYHTIILCSITYLSHHFQTIWLVIWLSPPQSN